MDKSFHPKLHWACDYLSMLALKLNHVSKRGHKCRCFCCLIFPHKVILTKFHATLCVKKSSEFLRFISHSQVCRKSLWQDILYTCIQDRSVFRSRYYWACALLCQTTSVLASIPCFRGLPAVSYYAGLRFTYRSEFLQFNLTNTYREAVRNVFCFVGSFWNWQSLQ